MNGLQGGRLQIESVVALKAADRDLRNLVAFECGVCEAELSSCHHAGCRYTQKCWSCGSKYDIVWSREVVGITLLEVGET